MTSILTNSSAMTALRQLRQVQGVADRVRDMISTGLRVQRPSDNAAFFLVTAKAKADTATLGGFRDNLAMIEGALQAADAGLRQLQDITLAIADFVPIAQTGVAMEEQEKVFQELMSSAREIVRTTGFNGANLLQDDEDIRAIIGVDRQNGSYNFQNLMVQSAGLDRIAYNNAIVEVAGEFVINAENYSGKQDIGANSWEPSLTDPGFLEWGKVSDPNQIYFTPAEVTASSPRLDYRVQVLNPGRYYVNVRGIGSNGTSDSIHVGFNGQVLSGTGGVRIPTAGGNARWGTRDTLSGQRVFVDIPAAGLYTINIWGRENGTRIDGLVFTQDPSNPGATDPLPPLTSFAGKSDLPFFTDLIEGAERRERAGFLELLSQLNPEAMRLAPEASMIVLDAARQKLSAAQAEFGAIARKVDRQKTYLTDLTARLDEGVAALVEADLAEASSRLQAIQVSEQLALEGLTRANQRPSAVLSLFR